MRQINEAHVARPGLAVVEVAAADDATAFASRSCSPRSAQWRRRTVRPGILARPACGCGSSWTFSRTLTCRPAAGTLAVLVPGCDGAPKLAVLGAAEVCHAREHLQPRLRAGAESMSRAQWLATAAGLNPYAACIAAIACS